MGSETGMVLHNKCALVWEVSGYPRNMTSIGLSSSVRPWPITLKILPIMLLSSTQKSSLLYSRVML